MSQRIGIVQTRGIGDIIIALPIAEYFVEQGHEVYWPIDRKFVDMFSRAKPEVNFLAVDGGMHEPRGYLLNDPLRLLGEHSPDRTIMLYSIIGNLNISDVRLSRSLKFDEYKYAIAGVPFERKWTLEIERDLAREQALFDRLNIERDYVVVHDRGFDFDVPIQLPPEIQSDFQVVRVEELTDSPFDWLLTLERAAELFMIDSSLANLVEQLNLPNRKRLYFRSDLMYTPVYKNGWRFSFFEPSQLI
jgi:hypothetical protein